ncbi:hypothetical protein JXA32_03535 [Candidatus Sumerlaeota bacterium]|nr:hypothetical protein [Candidatus Sumerlaeota bacterium]
MMNAIPSRVSPFEAIRGIKLHSMGHGFQLCDNDFGKGLCLSTSTLHRARLDLALCLFLALALALALITNLFTQLEIIAIDISQRFLPYPDTGIRLRVRARVQSLKIWKKLRCAPLHHARDDVKGIGEY